MKRTNYIGVRRTRQLGETQVIQEKQKIVIAVRKKGKKKYMYNIRYKESLPQQQINLEGYETLSKVYTKLEQGDWDLITLGRSKVARSCLQLP